MISYDEAFSIVKREFDCLKTGITEIPLEDAPGYKLAENIYTDTFLPPFDNSSMDGYAVKFSEGQNCWDISGEISAGNYSDFIITETNTVRIMTGGKIPSGADTVIPVEDVIEQADKIFLREGTVFRKGRFIRKKGEDITPEKLVLSESSLLKFQNISIAAACGKKTLKVYKKLKAGVLTTGDELIDISETPTDDKIRGTNLYSILSIVKSFGMSAVNLGVLKDDKELIKNKIAEALNSDIDLLITTGGVSVGKFDYLKEIYSELGVEIYFNKVNIKPGKPVVFGRYKEKLIFGLPGNPVSSFVSLIIFFRRAVSENSFDSFCAAELKSSVKKDDSRMNFVRGNVMYDSSAKKYFVEQTGNQSSGNMAGLNNANCLFIVPAEKNSVSAGEVVECILI